jgi:glutamyl-Q tRNA(Asp) synthetase
MPLSYPQITTAKTLNKPGFYRGRFAPTSSGKLHFGSLVTAVASYSDAIYHNGEWLLRIDDIDEGRARPKFIDSILMILDKFGFEWSGKPTYQTERKEIYASTVKLLLNKNLAFPCGCSRKEIGSATPSFFNKKMIYPGTCANGLGAGKEPKSVRVRVEDKRIIFEDRFAGPISQNVSKSVGDFVIQRAHVLRGADLLSSTPRQLFLQELLDYSHPTYGHIPLVVDSFGKKLSKSNGVDDIFTENMCDLLLAAWNFLGQKKPDESIKTASDFWLNAKQSWQPTTVYTPHYF